MSSATERDRLIGELSDLAMRIVQSGGPCALAASAGALVEGAAAAMPPEMIPGFCKALLDAVASGARIAGHSVTVLNVGTSEMTGSMH